MLAHLLRQGVPRGAEGQEFSKLLPGTEERTPGFWCCWIQVREPRDWLWHQKHNYTFCASRCRFLLSIDMCILFIFYLINRHLLIYLLIYILRALWQSESHCAYSWAYTELIQGYHLHRNSQFRTALTLEVRKRSPKRTESDLLWQSLHRTVSRISLEPQD